MLTCGMKPTAASRYDRLTDAAKDRAGQTVITVVFCEKEAHHRGEDLDCHAALLPLVPREAFIPPVLGDAVRDAKLGALDVCLPDVIVVLEVWELVRRAVVLCCDTPHVIPVLPPARVDTQQ